MFSKFARKRFSTTSSVGGRIEDRLESLNRYLKDKKGLLGLLRVFTTLVVGGGLLYVLDARFTVTDHKIDFVEQQRAQQVEQQIALRSDIKAIAHKLDSVEQQIIALRSDIKDYMKESNLRTIKLEIDKGVRERMGKHRQHRQQRQHRR